MDVEGGAAHHPAPRTQQMYDAGEANTIVDTSPAETGDSHNSGRITVLSRRLPESTIKKETKVNGTLLRLLVGDPPVAAAGNSFDILIQYRNSIYPVTCRSRLTGKYKKWVLSYGWLDLVRANDLKAGHAVTLFKPEDGAWRGLFVMEDGAYPVSDLDSVSLAAEALLELKRSVPAIVADAHEHALRKP